LPSVNTANTVDRTQQVAEDEEFARQLQREEELESVPFRYNTGFFHPVTTRSGQMLSSRDDNGRKKPKEIFFYQHDAFGYYVLIFPFNLLWLL